MKPDSTGDRKTLKLGDTVRIIRIPSCLSEPHYQNGEWDETLALYRALISSKEVLTIAQIDEHGRPWIECESHDTNGNTISNTLAMDDDSWVRVD